MSSGEPTLPRCNAVELLARIEDLILNHGDDPDLRALIAAYLWDCTLDQASDRLVAAGSGACRAITKKGKPCPIDPRPSGLCHVHDPAVQCGYRSRGGRVCAVATGGGRCARHK